MQQRDPFHELIIAALPRLRVQAAALTRNRAAAQDLVQDAVANALAARDRFEPGTNFRAWMHRILYHRFVSSIRRQRREVEDVDDLHAASVAVAGRHEDRVVLRELRRAILRLPPGQRTMLLMVALQGMPYEEVSAATGVAVGTAKSRVFRARRQLEAWLMGSDHDAPGTAGGAESHRHSTSATR